MTMACPTLPFFASNAVAADAGVLLVAPAEGSQSEAWSSLVSTLMLGLARQGVAVLELLRSPSQAPNGIAASDGKIRQAAAHCHDVLGWKRLVLVAPMVERPLELDAVMEGQGLAGFCQGIALLSVETCPSLLDAAWLDRGLAKSLVSQPLPPVRPAVAMAWSAAEWPPASEVSRFVLERLNHPEFAEQSCRWEPACGTVEQPLIGD